MSQLSEFLIRVSSFIRKEMAEILRQPKLVGTLILGPFLILLLFGVGYNNSVRQMRTVMVIPSDSKVEGEIRDIASRLGGAVELVGFVSTRQEAEQMLRTGEAELVLVTPADPFGDVMENQQAQMEVLHQEIDPIEQMFVNTLERAYIEEVNRLIMIRTLDRAKDESNSILQEVQQARSNADSLQVNLENGNSDEAARDIVRLAEDFHDINIALTSSLAAFEGVRSLSEPENTDSPFDHLLKAEEIMLELQDFDPEQTQFDEEIGLVENLEDELGLVGDFLANFEEVDSRVLARPFVGKTATVLATAFGPIDFYVPGVISLLLQHIAITLAALAIVRERGGAIELFRTAPVNALETLLGKTISFLILSGILAAVLSALVIFGLNVPMLGSWLAFVAIIFGLLFTSLAMGFAISTISETDSQAIQYSMIVLLASIFFSGFFIALYRLLPGVHVVSWLLPATYGTNMLQDVMLRGYAPDPILLGGLVLFGLVLYLFAWWRLRHLMART